MNLQGTIKLILEPLAFESGFTKQELILTIKDGEYSNDIKIEFLKDKTSLLLNFKVGDNVDVAVNLRGKEYNGTYYNNIVGWRIAVNNSNAPENVPEPSKPVEDSFDAEESDSVPF